MIMNTDLLQRTKKQVIDLVQHKFFKQADEIVAQALKVFNDLDLKSLQVITKIGLESWEEAEKICLDLCEQKTDAANFSNLSVIQRNLKNNDAALKSALSAIDLNANNPNFYANLAGVYWDMDAYEDAFKYLDKAIKLAPDSHALQSNKAAYLFETNHVKEAIQSYKTAIKLCPENPTYYVEIFYCLASIGEYEKAWQFYEYRYQSIPQVALVAKHSKLPVLHKRKDKYSENIAIVLEQGLGDTIMYLRFLEEFQEKAPNSYLVCDDKKITELLQNKNIHIKDKIESSSTHIIGLLSLPYHLNVKEIPKPFNLGTHSPTTTNQKKIGIVWAGSAYHPMDSIRSTYLTNFKTIYDDQSINISHFMTDLRKRKRAKSPEVIDYAEGLVDLDILDYGSKCNSIADTVRELNNIDILVTVDTAIAHIAGSIGVPTYLLVSHVSDWRWGRFGDKSDWYNSIQIKRNTKNGSYADLITDIHKKIGES